jgi:hypothetical protein
MRVKSGQAIDGIYADAKLLAEAFRLLAREWFTPERPVIGLKMREAPKTAFPIDLSVLPDELLAEWQIYFEDYAKVLGAGDPDKSLIVSERLQRIKDEWRKRRSAAAS